MIQNTERDSINDVWMHSHMHTFVLTANYICTHTHAHIKRAHYKILLRQQITQTSLFISGECVYNREGIAPPAALVDDTATYSLTNRPFALNESHI